MPRASPPSSARSSAPRSPTTGTISSGPLGALLEELIRAAAEGQDEALPETVLAMLQIRLEALPLAARRVLRAASLFGQACWPSGVAEVLGTAEVTSELMVLERNDVLTRRGARRRAGELEYRFRHALLGEAAYGMLTDRDRRTGHELAGDWLERAGDADPMALAEHVQIGGEPGRAAMAYLEGARQALRGHDLGTAVERAERGLSCGLGPEITGALQLVQVEAHVWRGELALTVERGTAAPNAR